MCYSHGKREGWAWRLGQKMGVLGEVVVGGSRGSNEERSLADPVHLLRACLAEPSNP